MNAFLNLFSHKRVYFDGSMGTRLQALGLMGGEKPENWNLSHPEAVKSVYGSYLRAGTDMVTANTFGANPLHFPDTWAQVMRAGITLAKEAVAETGSSAIIGMDAGSIGQLLKPLGEMEFEDAVSIYREMALVGIAEGCGLLLAETMTDLREVKAAVLGYREAKEKTGSDVPVLVSLSFDVSGRLLTGADIEGVCALLTSMEGVDILGMNCGREPAALLPNLKRMLACAGNLPVLFMPNASVPTIVDGKTVFATKAAEFAADMQKAAELGARALGGCCGTTEEHIAAMIAQTKDLPLPALSSVDADNGLLPVLISGRSETVTLGHKPLIIGERLNPTGKKRMKQALKENDIDYLLGEATAQIDAFADVLDVNVGSPEIDEAAMLPVVTEAVQGVAGLPLQLDTADPAALEAALRVYVGKPIINSVNGKAAVMEQVFPLARKYGGALVALVLDEDGIPETVEGRLAIARRILAQAERYGVPKRDLLFDALTMTVATDPNAALTTLETVRRLHEELKVKTVLGVSNVSFGLPSRSVLTAAFLSLAVERGLSAAIINPLDTAVRATIDGAWAVMGRDDGFANYLKRYAGEPKTAQPQAAPSADATAAREAIRVAGEAIRKAEAALHMAVSPAPAGDGCGCSVCAPTAPKAAQPAPTAVPAGDAPLFQAIVRGLEKAAVEGANTLMDGGAQPLTVVEDGVIPALAEVGARYERGEFFLPQLMQSANAAKKAIAAATARMPESKPSPERTVMMATVHGDVHDIGKNIVGTLLSSYGFGVIDLGRDMPPETVLAEAKKAGVKLVGLSALMTTTVPAMRKTIELLRAELPQVNIMVGGAVLTEELAKDLGADGYTADAMGAVRYAKNVLDGK